MKAITIRGVDADMAERLKQAALKQGKSVNQMVIDIIKKDLGIDKEKQYSRVYSDLDHLFGRWTDDEFKSVQGKIDGERIIDRDLWK